MMVPSSYNIQTNNKLLVQYLFNDLNCWVFMATIAKAAKTLNFSENKPTKNRLEASNRFKTKRLRDLYLLSV